MPLEHIIEGMVWVFSILLFLVFIPKNKKHQAYLSYLIMQVPSWFLGILVVQFHLLEYPVRFFPNACRTSFTYEFFALPIISAIFNVHYPSNKGILYKTIYSIVFPTVLTFVEVMFEKHTNLILYINWHWYYTWISLLFVLYLSYWGTALFFNTLTSKQNT